MSVEAFGKRIGASSATVSRLENGKQCPSWGLMSRIVSATDGAIRPEDFFPADARGGAQ